MLIKLFCLLDFILLKKCCMHTQRKKAGMRSEETFLHSSVTCFCHERFEFRVIFSTKEHVYIMNQFNVFLICQCTCIQELRKFLYRIAAV